MRGPFGLLAVLIAGCATDPVPPLPLARDRVILLPGAGGSTGAVSVTRGDSAVVLDRPYALAAAGDGPLQVEQADPAAIRLEFAHALQALPAAPLTFVAFFVFGQDELTEASRKAIAPFLAEAARRPAPEITVLGHADQVGADAVNDALSLRRAERMRELLIGRGVPAERITVGGRGAREPLVRSPEGAPEPRNRRVEITVR